VQETGGHAGLARGAAALHGPLLGCANDDDRAALLRDYCATRLPLMQIWNASFSAAAGHIRDALSGSQRIGRGDAARLLESRGLAAVGVDRAFKELVYTGVARSIGDELVAVNRCFWSYMDRFPVLPAGEVASQTVWKLIERSELMLREHVKGQYVRQWPSRWQAVMQEHLGEEAWRKILQTHEASLKNYPYVAAEPPDIIACLYLGQLRTLIEHWKAWPLFSKLFKDKRHAQDLFADITPVRNDQAHFKPVPEKELRRCQLACEDILFIVDRHQDPSPP
jgi:hypothetical protein